MDDFAVVTANFMLPVLLGVVTSMGFGAYTYVSKKLPLLILRPGHKKGTETPEDYGLPYDHIGLRVTETIELDAYFVPATTPVAKANLIILHGVGSCKEVYLPNAAPLCALGYNLFLADQRQHGKSGGRYLTYGHYEKYDVAKMTDWLAERTGRLKTGIYGNSMGAAVALQAMAHDHRLAFGLIESTFTDLRSITNAYAGQMIGRKVPLWLSDFLLRRAGKIADFDPFAIQPLRDVAKIDRPLQFIHGDSDARIDLDNARQLYAASIANDKDLYVVPKGDHADLWEVGDKGYPEKWFGFLQRMVDE